MINLNLLKLMLLLKTTKMFINHLIIVLIINNHINKFNNKIYNNNNNHNIFNNLRIELHNFLIKVFKIRLIKVLINKNKLKVLNKVLEIHHFFLI